MRTSRNFIDICDTQNLDSLYVEGFFVSGYENCVNNMVHSVCVMLSVLSTQFGVHICYTYCADTYSNFFAVSLGGGTQ